MEITLATIKQLIRLERGVHYSAPPPAGQDSFITIRRNSSVLLSAPHGCITHRNNEHEEWHSEDEYTAGMALLLGEVCQVSVIATTWRDPNTDPNYHPEARSPYKQEVRKIALAEKTRWVIDLHGAREDTVKMTAHQWIDLGTRKSLNSFPSHELDALISMLTARFGPAVVSQNAFPAHQHNRTITAYCHGALGIPALQIELKPRLRVAERLVNSTMYQNTGPYGGPYQAPEADLMAILDILASFIHQLKQSAPIE